MVHMQIKAILRIAANSAFYILLPSLYTLKIKFNMTSFSIEQTEDIDVFGTDFSNNSNETFFNPYNLENVSDLCENLTSDGGVKKLLIKRGTGSVVPADANVTVKYMAFTEFAKAPFDHTTKPYNIDIGMSTFKGLAIALASMRKGEKANFYIAPEYAFGRLGCPPKIPPNSTCLFVIELLDYEEVAGAGEYFHRPGEERREASYEIFVSVVKTKMKEAKQFFSIGHYKRARDVYRDMATKLGSYEEEEDVEWKKLMISLNSNAALCSLKLNDFESCIKYADVALDYDLKYVKALYAKGKALSKLGQIDSALGYLIEAKKINPKNREINQELHYLDTYVEKSNKVEKELCLRMMQEVQIQDEDKEKTDKASKDESMSMSEVASALHQDVSEEFTKHLNDLKNSSDSTEEMVISSDSFSSEELRALEAIAKSFELKVCWTKSDGCDYIKISKY